MSSRTSGDRNIGLAPYRMSKPKVCLELARLTGTSETWPRRTWLDKFEKNEFGEDPVNRLCSLLDAIELESSRGQNHVKKLCSYLDTLELDQKSQSCRFSADHSGGIPWQTLKYLCQLANLSQSFYRSVSREQWLRTVITSEKSRNIFVSEQDKKKSNVVIHSNVMPRQAYLTRLEGMKTCTCLSMTGACFGCHCFKGFFPANVSCEGQFSRKPCGKCPLVEQLKNDYEAGSEFVKFWFLAEADVKLVTGDHGSLGEGSEGAVSKILWRKGIFARKRFYCESSFDKELEVVMEMSHPNIVHCFGCSLLLECAEYDLFMELLEEDLGTHLQDLNRTEEPLLFQDLLDVLLQVAEAMKHLHDKNFVHGDLKPGNILLSRLAMPHSDAQYYLVKVADFGCAQRVNSSGGTVKPFCSEIGTLHYTAPEVFRCRPRYGGEPEPKNAQKIDVYSFGVVAFQVLTGVSDLYENLRRSEIIKGVVGGWLRPDRDFNGSLDGERLSLLPFVQRCWAQEPADRPSFTEICEGLLSVVMNDHGLREIFAKRKRHDNIDAVSVRPLKALWPGNKDSRGTC
ncbi:hypothetical protein KC19_12G148000 [Ceratodon purpureus]|uniref:Protein kinase domain-containing protein n=1 Tax=Ceratodon purpureus TaxID=3225 RepID=A0A8T0G9V7_CERPU|nr:hypothetical protein KC19_12G148000 [Ceratodon purpureus]